MKAQAQPSDDNHSSFSHLFNNLVSGPTIYVFHLPRQQHSTHAIPGTGTGLISRSTILFEPVWLYQT